MTDDRFLATLTRATLVAGALAFVFLPLLPRQGAFGWDLLDVFTLAFCFTFMGHYVDRLLAQVPGIGEGAGRLVRMAGWFAGGLWCYVVGRYLWIRYGRDPGELPSLIWGGVFFVVFELVRHAVLQARGRPSFFSPEG